MGLMDRDETSWQGLGRWLLLVVVLGLAARLAATAPLLGRIEDPDNYVRLARGLAAGRGFVWDGLL